VQLSLQTWVAFYEWKNVNPALTSLSQLMKIKKKSQKIEEIAYIMQHLFVKEKIMQMLWYYQRRRATLMTLKILEYWIFTNFSFYIILLNNIYISHIHYLLLHHHCHHCCHQCHYHHIDLCHNLILLEYYVLLFH